MRDGAQLQLHLERGTLNDVDKEQLAFTRVVRTHMQKRRTIKEIADITEKSPYYIRRFISSAAFRVCCDYLTELETMGDAQDSDVLVRKAREEFLAMAPDALEYYRDCFARHPEEAWPKLGKWKSDEKAQWASQQVAKGLGLSEPEHATRPIIQINLQHMQFEMNQVDAEDALDQQAIDVTPQALE
jgi:hypothetical protein